MSKRDILDVGAKWDFTLGNDSTGDPAVWVTLFIDEQTMPLRELGRILPRFTEKILRAFSAVGINRRPYESVCTAAEF